MFKEQGLDAVILNHNIDTSFITPLEQRNDKIKFQRIDADITDNFKEESESEDIKEVAESLTDIFRKALDNEKLEVKVEKLKNPEISSVITLSEESRRMQDMMRMYNMSGMDDMFAGGETLILNANNNLVKYIFDNPESENNTMLCQQLYDLAMISHRPLSADEMTKFVQRSNDVLMMLTK